MHCSADCIVVAAGGLAEPIREPMGQGIIRAYRLLYSKQYEHSNEDQTGFRSSFPSCLPLGGCGSKHSFRHSRRSSGSL